MFGRLNKRAMRMAVVGFVLVTVWIGCGQEPTTPESREASLKKLEELSREGNEEKGSKSETHPAAQEEGKQEKQQ